MRVTVVYGHEGGRCLQEVLMKRLPLIALAGMPLLLATACGSTGRAGVDNPRTSVTSHFRSAPASACTSASSKGNPMVMVEWVDFVQLEGRQYIAGVDDAVSPVPSSQLGAVVGRVTCQLSALKFSKEPGPSVDGDAAFLAIGTEVRAIQGFEPSCRVAARIDGANRVYLAHRDVGGFSKAVPCAKAP